MQSLFRSPKVCRKTVVLDGGVHLSVCLTVVYISVYVLGVLGSLFAFFDCATSVDFDGHSGALACSLTLTR
jgi:hypothetical protein